MALTASQIASKLFKKSLGAGETLVSRQFFEEPKLGRDLVLPGQIWSQADTIPTTAPVLSPGATSGVLQYFEKELLSHVSGSQNLSYFSSNLIDSIPFNFGDGTYNYTLYKNDGTTQIAFGEGDWLVDNTAGLLTFYGTLPSGVTSVLPPKITFYKYIGGKGFAAGSGVGTITGVVGGVGLTGGGTQGSVTLDVNLGQNSGLTFSGDYIIIDSNIAGNGLDLSSGVLTVNTSEITPLLAGSGLTSTGGSLGVLVNSDSLEIISNVLRLKDTILGNRTFQDSVTIGGNLTVNGTVSYINTENLLVEDNIITLNATFSGSPILDAGIEINRGSSQSSKLLWDEVLDLWVAGLSGSTSPILIEAGLGLTKSGNTVILDFNSITGTGLTQSGGQISINNNVLATSLAGDGLSSNGGTLSVNVGIGLTISSDIVNVIWGGTSSGLTFSNNSIGISTDGSTVFINNLGQLSAIAGSAIPRYQKKISLSTSGDNQPTGLTLSFIPSNYSRVQIFVNGQTQFIGDGTKSGVECYFSNDGGFTAKNLSNLNISDELYWNLSSSGFNLSTNDMIYVIYES